MHGYKAPPLSRADIRAATVALRRQLSLEDEIHFPILEFAELILPQLDEKYQFAVDDARSMGTSHGLTERDGDVVIVTIRDDVYERACRGEGRDRGTVAHEVGHYYLHARSPRLSRAMGEMKRWEDPEWQAMCWQGGLLIPRDLVRGMSAHHVAALCGVSLDAAKYQLNVYASGK